MPSDRLVPILEWSPTTGPLEDPVWEDITDHLVSGRTTRGRASEFDQIAAGKANFVCDGTDRIFDPAYNPNALPGRRIRLSVPYGPIDPETAVETGALAAHWDARSWDGTTADLPDLSGNGLDCSIVTAGSGAYVPVLCPWEGRRWAFFPGWADEGASSARITPTGVLDVRVDMDALQNLDIGGTHSWPVHLSGSSHLGFAAGFRRSDGRMELHFSTDGTTSTIVTSTANPRSVQFGQRRWVRDPATGDVDFYQRDPGVDLTDDSGWFQVGATVSAATGAIHTHSSQVLSISGTDTFGGYGMNFGGRLNRLTIADDSTLLVDFDPSNAQPPYASFDGPLGETWTFFRASATPSYRVDIVDQTCVMLGNGSGFSAGDVLDVAAGESRTIVHVFRHQVAAPSVNGLVGKGSNDLNPTDESGYGLAQIDNLGGGAGTGGLVSNVSDSDVDSVLSVALGAPNPPRGVMTAVALVIDRTASTSSVYVNGVLGDSDSIAAVGSLANSDPFYIGIYANSGQQAWVATAVYDAALASHEIARLGPALIGHRWPVYTGWLDDLPETIDPSTGKITVSLDATDAFKALARHHSMSPWAEEVALDSPRLHYRLGENTAEVDVLSDSSGYNADLVVDPGPFAPVASLVASESDGAQDLPGGGTAYATGNAAEHLGAVASTGAFGIEAWVQTSASGVDQIILGGYNEPLGDAGAVLRWGLYITSTGTARAYVHPEGDGLDAVESSGAVNDGEVHHLFAQVEASDGKIVLYIDGVEEARGATVTVAAQRAIAQLVLGQRFDGVLDEVAVYNAELTPARILSHYQAGLSAWSGDRSDERIDRLLDLIGWPGDMRSLEVGASLLQGANGDDTELLAHVQAVERTEQGRFFVDPDGVVVFHSRHHHITSEDSLYPVAYLSDAGSGAEAFSGLETTFGEANVSNDVVAQRTGGLAQRVTDQTSVDRYFQQSREDLSGLLSLTDAEARALAEYVLDRYKEPAVRVEALTLLPERDLLSLGHAALGTDLGQRIEVTKERPVGAAVVLDVVIEGINHEFDVGGAWTTNLRCSPLFTGDEYLLLDHATRGLLNTGRLAY